jgi:hypothetical protein
MNDNGELEFDETHNLNTREMKALLGWADGVFANGGILITRKDK